MTLDLVWIPPGTFAMGSPAGETGRHPEEGPPARVTLTKGFWLGQTLVTIGQWKNVMGVGVRGPPDGQSATRGQCLSQFPAGFVPRAVGTVPISIRPARSRRDCPPPLDKQA